MGAAPEVNRFINISAPSHFKGSAKDHLQTMLLDRKGQVPPIRGSCKAAGFAAPTPQTTQARGRSRNVSEKLASVRSSGCGFIAVRTRIFFAGYLQESQSRIGAHYAEVRRWVYQGSGFE